MFICRITLEDLRKYGVKFIKGRQYKLPVSEDDFHGIANTLFDAYVEQLCLMKVKDKTMFSVGLIEISFVHNMIQALHSELKDIGEYNCLFTDLSRVEKRDSIDKKLNESSKYYEKIYQIPKIKRYIRRFIKFFYFNSISCIFFNTIKKNKTICLGSTSKLRADFINKERLCCDYLDWVDLIDMRNNNSSKISNEVALFEKNVVDPFLHKIITKDAQLSELLDRDKIKTYWKRRVSKILSYYHNVNHEKIDKLLVTEAAKPIHKLIMRAYEDADKKTYLFHHGNDTALTIQNIAHVHNIAHGENIVVPTLGIANQYNKVYGNSPLNSIMRPKYYNVYSNKKLYTRRVNQKNHISTTTRPVVMLMGYPYNDRRYTDERGMYFITHAILEYKILDYLKTINDSPLYKVHPDRSLEASDILREYSDTFIHGKFEDIYHMADVIIFTYVSTTTFGYALTTDKKIVLIEDIDNEKDKDQWSILRKRVNTISATLNQYGEYEFDLGDIKNNIFSKTHEIDHTYSNQYL